MILITGGSGFVGSGVAAACADRRLAFRLATRKDEPCAVAVGEVEAGTDWSRALQGVKAVIHLAGIAHRRFEQPSLQDFRRVNVDGSINLAQQMARIGVNRLVFVSSIGVLGDTSSSDSPLSDRSPANPITPYAVSKYEAECRLKRTCSDYGVELVIVRPPLVYGRNAKGNFAALVRLVASGLPLPFASVKNRRNIISLENTAEALLECAIHPRAAGETFLLAETDVVSTADIVKSIAAGLRCPARLVPFPQTVLKSALHLVGQSRRANGLLASLEIDSSKITETIGWKARGRTLENIERTLRRASA